MIDCREIRPYWKGVGRNRIKRLGRKRKNQVLQDKNKFCSLKESLRKGKDKLPTGKNHFKSIYLGVPCWHSRLSDRLFLWAQVIISEL